MTAADATMSDFATRGDLELLRRDLRIVEERLQGQMHQLEIRLMRWTIATLLAGMGIAAAIAAAIVQVVG